MKNWIKKYLEKLLGIDTLLVKIKTLETVNEQLKEGHRRLEIICGNIANDNSIILNHVKMINKDFSVVADVNTGPYEPTVVIVMRKYQGQQDVVKTYAFNDKTMEHVYHFLLGFGKENVRIDQGPRRFKGPDFLY